MLEELIAESSNCDFKESLEEDKPKSWLKTVSSFANGVGGRILFGVTNEGKIKNILDPQKTIEKITSLIESRIIPVPSFFSKPQKRRKLGVHRVKNRTWSINSLLL